MTVWASIIWELYLQHIRQNKKKSISNKITNQVFSADMNIKRLSEKD